MTFRAKNKSLRLIAIFLEGRDGISELLSGCPQGRPRIDRITYEICALEALRDQLRGKEVWVAGANRYRNPDEDLPADFDAQRAGHYQALDLPLDASAFIDGLREEMHAALAELDPGLPRNPDVRITSKRGPGSA